MDTILKSDAQGGVTTQEILDTSVAYERFEGIVTIFSVIEYPPCGGRGWTILFPLQNDYVTAATIATLLRQQGTPVGAIDILIASICIRTESVIVTKDNHFSLIKKIMPALLVKKV